ncbi:MAG: glycosyltransferase family 2 protein [Symploca sp. SIO2E9]|nr:glycosyltransferase family 2 protein [Symploca sp. SIO2E9]
MNKVSIIVPVYRAEKFIAATVNSVLEQTYDNFELLIIDDDSPDRSIEICQQFQDSRIKIFRQQNRGLSGARNTGIRHAQGEYLAFLDPDDLWLPEKLEKHVQHLNSSPDVGISFSRSAFIDEDGKSLGIYQMPRLKNIDPHHVICRNPIGNGSAGVFRKEVFAAIKYQDNIHGYVEDFYFDENFRVSQDVECWLRIVFQTSWQIEGIPEALTLYRVNSQGISSSLQNKLDSVEMILEKTRSYAPKFVAKWENPVKAYYLRYVARRAVSARDGSKAVELFHRAIATHWRILLEEPRRTILTGGAAYLLSFLPQSIYQQVEALALKQTGTNQRRQILQEQSS